MRATLIIIFVIALFAIISCSGHTSELYAITVTDTAGEIVLKDYGYKHVNGCGAVYEILQDDKMLIYVRRSDNKLIRYSFQPDHIISVIPYEDLLREQYDKL